MSDWSSTLMKRPDLMGEWMAAMILAALCSGEMQIAMSLALTASFPAKALPTVSRAFSVATMPGCTETTLMCGNSSLSFLAIKLRAALEAPYAPDGNGRWLWMDPPIVDTNVGDEVVEPHVSSGGGHRVKRFGDTCVEDQDV
ncbi:hypothetical protein WICPIJ_003177 [Wickerhamomyces pijperi]|uniref:Uncharacterized protein n=1 Tax=Wickerhamomyces pijperi TaxID=599730 RepID=A0A9P8TPH0_WICPI|nr:hypothetical protein WICPIJ_003177 [Wickerhamomyces pijperi]